MKVLDASTLLHVSIEDVLSIQLKKELISKGIKVEDASTVLSVALTEHVKLLLHFIVMNFSVAMSDPFIGASYLQVVELVEKGEQELVVCYFS